MPPLGWAGPGTYWRTCDGCPTCFRVRPCEVRKATERGCDPPRFCSRSCRDRSYLGDGNPKWRGGRKLTHDGYVYVHAADHPHATVDGYVLEHRLAMERHIGRLLDPTEQVHHIDHVRDHNEIENLDLMPSTSAHRIHHGYWQNQPCARCDAPCRRSAGHRRRWSRAYCSRTCTALDNLEVLNGAAA